jgi:hypothetical protein
MRLADFCNPHFKDEHPSPVWFPAPNGTEEADDSRHPTHFARQPRAPEAASDRRRVGECRSSDVRVAIE